MSLPAIARSLLFALLCLAAPASASEVEARLGEADALRSSDPLRFRELLAAIDADARATPAQRLRLRYLQAYDLAFRGDYPGAVQAAKALIADSEEAALRFRAMGLIVNAHAATRDFAEGLRYIDQLMPMAPQIDDRELRHAGLGAAAILYMQLGQTRLGGELARQVLADQPSPRTRCFVGQLVVEARYRDGVLGAHLAETEALVDACAALDEHIMSSLSRSYLARHYNAGGEHRRAADLLDAHLASTEQTRYPHVVADVHAQLAEARLALGEPDAAEHHARQTLAHSQDTPNSEPRVIAYRVLHDVAVQRGDWVAALAHYRAHAEAEKARLDDVKAREMAFQLVRQETAEKAQSIALLNRQNEVLRLEQAVARSTAQNTALLAVLLALAAAAAAYWALKLARLQHGFRRLAETDTLTGVSNRLHFTREAERALAEAAARGQTLALVMFDLDHFKAINDLHGHATGDWALRAVAEACRARCRQQDRIGRLGGEEFAILLPDCDAAGARGVALQCRAAIAVVDTRPSGRDFRLSASFGVADTTSAGHDLHALMLQADQAMYRAKRGGRDRVLAWRPADG